VLCPALCFIRNLIFGSETVRPNFVSLTFSLHLHRISLWTCYCDAVIITAVALTNRS